MITLPKNWANSVGLNKNDTVGMKVQPDGTLSLYPKGTVPAPKRSTKVIDATDIKDSDFFFRQLVGAYVAGHTTILIKSAQPMSSEITSAVQSFVQTSIGLEMIEADDKQILIANLIEHDAIDTKKIIERMGSLAKGMILDVYEAAYTGEFKNIKSMDSRDTEIDRIYWLTSRQYNIYQKDVTSQHKTGLPPYEMTACLFLSRVLEGISDHAVMMSESLISMGDTAKGNNLIHKLGQDVTDLLTKSVKSWTSKDIALAEQSIRGADNIIRETIKISNSKNAADGSLTAAVETMLFSLRKMSEYCKNIAEFAFNLAME